MNITYKLKKIRDALLKVTENTYHYDVFGENDYYIVWMEDGEGNSLNADNGKIEQTITGTIDYYTKKEYDGNVDKIQNELSLENVSFILNSVQYEYETQWIHYEWRFEI